jgi:hyperosmotically inducible periplasmic protein
MKTTWNIAPALALLLVAATPASTRATGVPQVVEKTKEGAEKTKDAVVKGATVAAGKTKDGLSKSGEVMTNEWITARVHARFVDEELLKGSDISVDTDDHVVTLKGTVVDRAGRNRAARVASYTEGVHRVVNRLMIGPKRNN